MIIENAQNETQIWKVGFYIRLSREDVENENSTNCIKIHNRAESESVTSQRVILTDFLEKMDNSVFINEYVDDGYTGTNFDRPSFTRLIDDVRTKKINCVIVKDLSRFGRNYSEVGNFLEVLFPMLNVRFISIIDNCDSFLRPDSVSNIIVPVKNIMNESYCRDISLKVRSAFDARKRKGLFVGAFATYGYKKSTENHNKLIIDDEPAQIVKRIFREFLGGKTMCKIAVDLNNESILCPALYKSQNGNNRYVNEHGNKLGWKDNSIRRILSNPIYIGTLVQKTREKLNYKLSKFRKVDKANQIIIENAVEPIIEKEVFYNVQNILSKDTKISIGRENLDLLSGFLHCADCGHGMSKKKSRKGKSSTEFITYYNCSNYKRCGKAICSPHSIQKQELENAVWQFLKAYISIAVDFNEMISTIKKYKLEDVKTDNLEKSLTQKLNEKAKKQRFIDGLYPDLKNEIITEDEYRRFKKQAVSELENIENGIAILKKQIDKIKNDTQNDNSFISHFIKYKNVEKLDRQMIVEFVDDIVIHENKKIEIFFKYRDEFKDISNFIDENKAISQAKTEKVQDYGKNE